MKLTEDDLYRNSSQYKHWSFTPAQLAALRSKTNLQATERVKANVARQRAQRAKTLESNATASASEGSRANTPGAENSNGGTGANTPVRGAGKEVDCLTVAEEMRLVDKFCETAMELGKFMKTPPDVTATCIQFLRRFYLYNSLMTYDAQTISQTAMFLAMKTENMTRPSRGSNAEDYAAKLPNRNREQILAPEYLIVQALRFNFDVRHPFRGLKGAHLELADVQKGAYVPLAHDTRSAADLRSEMLRLPKKAGGAPAAQEASEEEASTRLNNAYAFASNILKTAAQLTDAYFHYTPSQIMLAAHLLADEPLTTFYLSTKMPASSPTSAKLLATLRACASLLSSHSSFTSSTTSAADKEARDKREKKEISALMKKLKLCRDPDKVDLVKLNQAQKRDAVKDGELEESKAKRRKLGRERAEAEADAFWGPELPKR